MDSVTPPRNIRNVPPTNIVDRVRALLAKAVSTESPAEAEALNAKAQELMARYRIEQAVLAGEGSRAGRPTMVHVDIPAPHAVAKLRILGAVARANACEVVWSDRLRRASVFGFADDLAATETLFASLLVQATAAVARAGTSRDSWGRVRTVSFRRSFFIAFASRIALRLQEAVDATVDAMQATVGTDLVPLLERRRAEVEAATREAFPRLVPLSQPTGNAEGWRSGTACADRADLGGGRRGRLSA
jgi:hypothetical protein